MKTLTLKPIQLGDTAANWHPTSNSHIDMVVNMHQQLYGKVGFTPPWHGYFALEHETVIGACSFKSPPQHGKVEIAYYTFPGNEGQGYATAMCRELVAIARKQDRDVSVTARTLPEQSPSTSVLRKTGFVLAGMVNDPEDGEVWEWQLPR
jgi:RimJ/RimL family protein N-acetyltransferase